MNGPPLCLSSVNQVCNENACKLNCKQWPAWVTCAGLPPRASALRRWQPPIRRRRRELPWTANHSTAATQSRLPPFLWLRAGQSVAVHTGVSSRAAGHKVAWAGGGGLPLPPPSAAARVPRAPAAAAGAFSLPWGARKAHNRRPAHPRTRTPHVRPLGVWVCPAFFHLAGRPPRTRCGRRPRVRDLRARPSVAAVAWGGR